MNEKSRPEHLRTMFADKIDQEFVCINDGSLTELSLDLLTYRLGVISCLRDALYATPIPAEMLETACNREGILHQLYLFWAEEAAKGDEVVDQTRLAHDCVGLWLDDLRQEYRHNLLWDKTDAEYQEFLAQMHQKTPAEIIDGAWEITCYNDLHTLIASEELPAKAVDALLTMEQPLQAVYQEFLQRDMADHMLGLLDTMLEIAELRHLELTHGYISTDAAIQDYVASYLLEYGPGTDQEQLEPEL